MDTELLKTFLEVERTRHFGRAAENLYLTPAAVSARIKQLEGIVGAPLLTRERKRVELTPAGEKLKPRARDVLDALERALEGSTANKLGPHQLSLGATPNIWEFILADRLPGLYASQPELALRAECHDSGYLLSLLQSRQLDAAFLFDPFSLEGLHCEAVAQVPLQLFSAKSGDGADLAAHGNYALIEWSVGFGIAHAERHSPPARAALVSSTGKIALDYLSTRPGSGYFPLSAAGALRKRAGLKPVETAQPIELTLYMLRLETTIKAAQLDAVKQLF